MAKLVITTQYRENYGFDEGKQYWKNKGGDAYYVENVPCDVEQLNSIVEKLRPQIEWSNDASEQSILHWDIVSDDFRTVHEKDQLEFYGEIKYPHKVFSV